MTAIPFLRSRLHRILIASLMAASLVPIWSSTYFPSQNGPWHLLMIQMLHQYNNPAFNYSEFYTPSVHAIPHLAHTLLVYALAFVFPLLVAHKIAISIYALLLPVSVFWLLATVNPTRMAPGYVSFLLIYNVPLFRGYHDFVLGIPLVLLTLTYWLRTRERMTAWRVVAVIVMIVCVYLSHVFNFLVLGLAMLVYTLHDKRSVRAVGHLALLFTPALLLLVEFLIMNFRQEAWLDTSELVFVSPPAAVEGFFRRFFETMSRTAGFLAYGPLLLGTPLVYRGLRRYYRRAGGVLSGMVANPALILFLACLVLYFITPYKLFGWHYVNVRFVPYVIVFCVASLSVNGHVVRRAFIATIAVASLGIYGILSMQIARTGERIGEYVSAANSLRPNSVMLPVNVEVTDDDNGEVYPYAHVYDYYQILRGGANGRGIARFNTITPLVYRTYPVSRRFPGWDPYRRNATRLAAVYDYVLVWGWDPFITLQLRDAKFALVYEKGDLRVFESRQRNPQHVALHD